MGLRELKEMAEIGRKKRKGVSVRRKEKKPGTINMDR